MAPDAPLINYSALVSQQNTAAPSVNVANLNNEAIQALLTLCFRLYKSIPTWPANFNNNDTAMCFCCLLGAFSAGSGCNVLLKDTSARRMIADNGV